MNELLIAVLAVFLLCMIVGYVKGFTRLVISLASMVLTIFLVNMAVPYVSRAIVTLTPLDEKIKQSCIEAILPEEMRTGEISPENQSRAIEDAALPEVLKEMLLENNRKEIYDMLGVTKFADYIASGIAVFVVKALSFLVTFLAVTILIRMTVFTLDSIRRLPVLHGFDRLAGAVLGLGFGLILVWLSFLVLTLACGTELGRECFLRIEQSKILTFLYRTNYLVNMMIVK